MNKCLSFTELNQARLSLKMFLSNYAWFNGTLIADGRLIVYINSSNPKIKEIIPSVYKNAQVHIHCV
jgi:hypothetical protein